MTRPEKMPSRHAVRRRLAAFCILHSAFFILPSCSALRDTLDFDSDDAADMTPHPRRAEETPSLIGPASVRVHPGKFPVVQFGAKDWKLTPAESAKVRSVARWMAGNPERVLVAAGARAESPEYARQLSDLRAQTVRRALVSAGVPDERILTVSFGEDAPPSTGGGASFSIIGTGDSR
jgi:outer membrane protein OmpA-like peptidoglycan-associated protein